MTIVRPRFRAACLALLLATANVALGFSYGNPAAWALLALPAVALFVRLPLAGRAATALTWLSRALIALLAVTGDDTAPTMGLVLSALAGLFLLDETAFPAERAALPAILGVLLAAAFNPMFVLMTPLAWIAAALLVAWLLSAPSGAPLPRRLASVALFALPAAVVGQGIVRFLPWAQPHVERVTGQYLAPENAETGLSAGPWLGAVEQLSKSKKVALRVWSDRPFLLRAAVHTRLNGRAWSGPETSFPPTTLIAPAHDVGAAEHWTRRVPGEWRMRPTASLAAPGSLARVVVAAPLLQTLPAPASVQALRLVDSKVRIDAFGLVLTPPRMPAVYGVKHADAPEPDASEAMVRECLVLPSAVDPRVRALADTIGAGAVGPEDKIARTVADLRGRCRYALRVGRWTTADPVAEFLFEKKKGYCEYFASATVILLRLQGVPARYVSGFSMRDDNRRGDHYVVRSSDAHAWAEALVPGRGWVEVDSTPPADFAAVQDELAMSRTEEMLEGLYTRWSDFMARLQEGGWGPILADTFETLLPARLRLPLLVAAIAAVGAWWLKRRARRRARDLPIDRLADVDPGVRSCFERLEQLWTRAGHPRPRHRGPLEHVAALPPDDGLRALSAEVVSSFYRSAYGGEPATVDEIARLGAALAEHETRGSDVRAPSHGVSRSEPPSSPS